MMKQIPFVLSLLATSVFASTEQITFENFGNGELINGYGYVYPGLTISGRNDQDEIRVIETGVRAYFAYGAPNHLLSYLESVNNCLYDDTGIRIDTFLTGTTAKGFANLSARNQLQGQTVTFNSEQKLSGFGLTIVDHGDYNPTGSTVHEIHVSVYNEGQLVTENLIHYSSDGKLNPRSSPEWGDLYFSGDACKSTIGDIGQFDIGVYASESFDTVKIEYPIGWDPNIGYDNLMLTFADTTFYGCTPGYWKNHSWDVYSPDSLFSEVFGVGPAITLEDAVNAGGGGEYALQRHATAALLNAADPDVLYPYTEIEVITMVQDAYTSGLFEQAKNIFEEANETECPK